MIRQHRVVLEKTSPAGIAFHCIPHLVQRADDPFVLRSVLTIFLIVVGRT